MPFINVAIIGGTKERTWTCRRLQGVSSDAFQISFSSESYAGSSKVGTPTSRIGTDTSQPTPAQPDLHLQAVVAVSCSRNGNGEIVYTSQSSPALLVLCMQ
jgi:hypothetical protein